MKNELKVWLRNITINRIVGEEKEGTILEDINRFYNIYFDRMVISHSPRNTRIYFEIDRVFYMEYDNIGGRLVCRYTDFWEILEDELKFDKKKSEDIMRSMVKEKFKEVFNLSDEKFNEMEITYYKK